MSLYGVIGYHVTLSEGHMIANHWLTCDPLRWSHDSQSPHIRQHVCPHVVATLIYLSQIYSYYMRGDRLPLIYIHSIITPFLKILNRIISSKSSTALNISLNYTDLFVKFGLKTQFI